MVLRNHENLPQQVDNDLDLMVPRAQLRMAEELIVAAVRNVGYTRHHRAEFGPLSLFFHDPVTLEQIQVDLFTSVAYRLLDLLPAREVLARRRVGPLFAIPDPVDEAMVNLLTRLLYHGRVKDKYKAGVARVFSESPEIARSRLAESFSSAEAALMVQAVQAGDWKAIEFKAPSFRT